MSGRPADWKPDLIWRHVAKGDGCWEWQAQRDKDGYGKFERLGGQYRAHRAVYELVYGPIPPGIQVCHRCDNPPCVRPEHLFLGTNVENYWDSRVKGRRTPTVRQREERECDACGAGFETTLGASWRFCGRACYLDVHSGRVIDRGRNPSKPGRSRERARHKVLSLS
jgi:hypothetical protein